MADGVCAKETKGPSRDSGRMFFHAPVGAELFEPFFTLNGQTLFVALQYLTVDSAKN